MSSSDERYEAWKKKKYGENSTPSTSSSKDRYNQWYREKYADKIQADAQNISSRVERLLNAYKDNVAGYNNRYKGRTFSSDDSYVSDAGKYYDDTVANYSAFRRESNAILKELEKNKSYFNEEWVKAITDTFSEMGNQHKSIVQAAKGDRDYWAQWENEDAYNRYQIGWLDPATERNAENIAGRQKYYQHNAERIAEIDELLSYDNAVEGFFKEFFRNEGSEESQERRALKEEQERLKAENTLYEHEQKVLDDNYIPITSEVQQIASKKDYENPTREEIRKHDNEFSVINNFNNSVIYGISDGNVVNNLTGKVVRPADEYSAYIGKQEDFYNQAIPDKLGMFRSASKEEREEANRAAGVQTISPMAWESVIWEGEDNAWDELTSDELTTYYYKLNTEGQASAYKFLDDMSVTLTRRATEKRADEISKAPVLEQIGLNIASVPMNIIGGGLSFIDDISSMGAGKEINPYSKWHAWQNDASAIRADTAQDIDNATGNVAIPWLDFSLGDAYQAGMSGLDSLAGATLLGGTGYGVLMGMGAASSQMKDLYERGASTEQMLAGGILAGAAEMIFEKYSIDKFLKMGDTKSIKTAVINILKQGGVEASEEAFTEIANTITDAMIMGSQANVKDLGTFVKNVVNAGLGGFLSGGGMGMVGSAASGIQYDHQAKTYGQKIIDKGGVESLKNSAAELTDNKTVSKLLNKLSNKMSARTVGKLADAIRDADIQETAYSLMKEGLRKKDAMRVAEYTQKVIEGYTPSESEMAEIERIVEKIPEHNDINVVEESAQKPQKVEREATPFNVLADDPNAVQREFSASETASEYDADTENVTLESASKKYGAQAGAMIHTYKAGQDVAKFDAAYKIAYDMGKAGVSLDYVKRSEAASYLSDTQKELAHEAGEAAADELAQKRSKRVSERKNGNTGRKKGVVKGENVSIEDLSKRFNDSQRKAYKILSTIAEVTGIDIVLYASETDADGNFVGYQGKFVWKEDTIYIDINAGRFNDKDATDLKAYTMLRTFTHEFVHFIEKYDAACYNELRELVFAKLTERGENVDELIILKRGNNMSYDAASREVVAESLTDILPDSRFVEELATEHKSLFERIVERFKEFLSDIKAYFASLSENPYEGARALKEQVGDSVKYLEDIVKLFDKAAKSAVENYQATVASEELSTENVAEDEIDSNGNPIHETEKRKTEPTDFKLLKLNRSEAVKKYGLSEKQSSTLEAYVRGIAYLANKRLLEGTASDSDIAYIQSIIGALQKFPVYKGRTYRNVIFKNEYDYNAFLEENLQGKVVDLKAITSTSKRPNGYPLFGKYVVHMVLDEVSGRDIADTYGIPKQQEVILLPGVRYKVNSVSVANDGHPIIFVKEIANNEVQIGDGDNGRRKLESSRNRENGRAVSQREGNDSGRVLLRDGRGAETAGEVKRSEIYGDSQVTTTVSENGNADEDIVQSQSREYLKGEDYATEEEQRNAVGSEQKGSGSVERTQNEDGDRRGVSEESSRSGEMARGESDTLWKRLQELSITSKLFPESAYVVPQNGTVEAEEYRKLTEYGIEGYVVKKSAWNLLHDAAAQYGRVYMRENLDERIRGFVAVHEVTHAMKQLQFTPYLEFIEHIPEKLDMSSEQARYILDKASKHMNADIFNADDVMLQGVYDEINATLYGYFVAGQINILKENAASAFYDFDAYIAELDLIHEQFKEDMQSAREQDDVETIQHQERIGAFTDREVLELAAEKISAETLSPGEADALRIFKKRMDQVKTLQAKRAELGKLYKEQQFGEKVDRTEAEKTLNRMKVLDDQIQRESLKILSVENKEILKDVIKRERQKAYDKARQKNREAIAKIREQRKITEVREKIKNFKTKLEHTLEHPTDRQYIPVSLAQAMVDVCSLIDTDTPLYKADGSLNKAQVRRDLTKERLQKLKNEYEAIKNNGDPMLSGEYDGAVNDYLEELREKYEDKSLADMTLDELEEMYSILRSINDTLKDARKMIGEGEARDIYEVGDAIIAEQNEISNKRKKGKAQAAIDFIQNQSLSPIRIAEVMSDYNADSSFLGLFKDFERGWRRKNMFVMMANKSFEELTLGENEKYYDDAIYNPYSDKTYTDDKGREFSVTKMQMMQCILSYEREVADNDHHIRNGGFTFADLELLGKGKLGDAVSEKNSHRVWSAVKIVESFAEELKNDAWAQSYMAAARNFFNGDAKSAVNKTMLALKHRIIAKSDHYIPYEVDRHFIVAEINKQHEIQETINSYGMLKEKADNATQPLIITGLNNMLDRHIEQVGTIFGLAIPVRNFNKVWNVKGENTTLNAVIEANWGRGGVKTIVQTVLDLQSERPSFQDNYGKAYRFVESGYISAQFNLNGSVVFKQVGSLFAATSMLKWRNPARMVGNLIYTMANHKKISAEVDKYTAAVWMRRQGLSDAELHTLATQAKKKGIIRFLSKLPKGLNPTKWIMGMDSMVALSLWRFAKQDTAKRTGLKGEELNRATAEFFDSVIENTQSMSDVLHRPEVQKSDHVFARSFGLFKTDLYQMSGQLQMAVGRYTHNKTKENGAALARTVYSVLSSAIWGQLITTLFALLRYKVDRYRDDEDDELTVESWLERQAFALLGDMAGYLIPHFGSEIVGIYEQAKYGESDDLIESIGLTAINGVIASIQAGDFQAIIKNVLQVFGIPANNIIRIVEAIKLHAEDIANGEFLSFNAGIEVSSTKYAIRMIEAVEGNKPDVAQGIFEDAVEDLAMRKAKGSVVTDKERNEARSDIKSAVGKKYKDGEIDRKTAENILSKCFELGEEDIYWTMDKWDYASENGDSDGYSRYDTVLEQVRKNASIDAAMRELTSHGYTEDEVIKEVKENIGKWYYDERSITKQQAISKLRKYTDMTEVEITSQVNKWTCKVVTGISYSDIKSKYLSGEITRSRAIEMLMLYGGKTYKEAVEQVKRYDKDK